MLNLEAGSWPFEAKQGEIMWESGSRQRLQRVQVGQIITSHKPSLTQKQQPDYLKSSSQNAPIKAFQGR